LVDPADGLVRRGARALRVGGRHSIHNRTQRAGRGAAGYARSALAVATGPQVAADRTGAAIGRQRDRAVNEALASAGDRACRSSDRRTGELLHGGNAHRVA